MTTVNFKIVKTDKIINKIFGFQNNLNNTMTGISPEFAQAGYESKNLMQNLGILFLALLALFGFIFFLWAMKFLAKRFAV